jgi:hypothetical protein
MRRLGDIIQDLGLKEDGPLNTKEAFVRHLIRAANATSPQLPLEKPEQKPTDAQLSFDPSILGETAAPKKTGTKP